MTGKCTMVTESVFHATCVSQPTNHACAVSSGGWAVCFAINDHLVSGHNAGNVLHQAEPGRCRLLNTVRSF